MKRLLSIHLVVYNLAATFLLPIQPNCVKWDERTVIFFKATSGVDFKLVFHLSDTHFAYQ